MSFHVGQKVVCVRTEWFAPPEKDETFPILGAIYTIRRIVDWQDDGPLGLQFCELVNPPHYDGYDCDFRADNFRPIVERKTDISFAHEILRNAKRSVDA